jgi:hypothetical protein
MEKNPFSAEGKTAGELLEAIKSLEQNPFLLSKYYVPTSHDSRSHLKRKPISKEMKDFEENSRERGHKLTLNLDRSIALAMKSQQKRSENETKKSFSTKSTTHRSPSLSVDNEQSMFRNQTSHNLSRTKDGTLTEIQSIEFQTKKQIQSALNLIPAHYFITHQMFDQIKTKSLDQMMKLLGKMRIKLLRQGMSLWHSRASQLTQHRRSYAAKLLNRMIRGFLGRLKAKKIYKQMLRQQNLQKKKMVKTLKTRHAQVIRIQSLVRCWNQRKKYLEIRKRHRSAIIIQRRYRSSSSYGRLLDSVNVMIKRNEAAKVIQRHFRGFLGRMLSRIRRSDLHREHLQQHYDTPQGVFAFYFEQHGAAFTIQKWYRTLWWVARLRGTERRVKVQLIHERKARVIQKIIRGYLARKYCQRLKQIRLLEKVYPLTSIILLQSVIRRYLTRCHHFHLLQRLHLRQQRRRAQQQSQSHQHDHQHLLQRRNAISFPHLKIGNERNLMRWERKATLIQRWYKSCRILRYFIRMISQRKVIYICRIQCWYRTWVWREKRDEAIFVIQKIWGKKIRNYIKKKRAVEKIQRKYRSYCSLKWFLNWKKKRHDKANLLKRWVLYRQWVRQKRIDIQKKRNFLEFLESGALLYHKSITYAKIDEVSSLPFLPSHSSPLLTSLASLHLTHSSFPSLSHLSNLNCSSGNVFKQLKLLSRNMNHSLYSWLTVLKASWT